MNRQSVNLVSATVAVVMSIEAFVIVLLVVTTGWDRHTQGSGAAEHLFQLLIAGQLPFLLTFVATAEWGRWSKLFMPMAFEAGALALAFGSLAYFKL